MGPGSFSSLFLANYFVDVEARACRRANGGDGTHAWRIRGRIYRPSHRRLRNAPVRNDRYSRIGRSRFPDENGRHAETNGKVSSRGM